MALRNPKFSCEVIQTCNRLISSKAEVTTFANRQKPTDLAVEAKEEPSHFRYVVANNQKSTLPEIQFEKDPDFIPPETRHLQPAMLPDYIEFADKSQVTAQVTPIRVGIQSPFPEPIKELRHKNSTSLTQNVSETKMPALKVNFKNLKVNGNYVSRMFSTRAGSPIVTSRFYSTQKSHRGKEECDQPQHNKKCKKDTGCPKHLVANCTPSKGSDCRHNYIDPKCTKKMAPYPSYSELCAERLPDDPSECMQCPWQRCGGTDAIKPPKRHFHTGTLGTQVAPTVNGAKVCNTSFSLFDISHCDARKEKADDKCPPEMHKKHKKPSGSQNISKKCDSLNWIEADRLLLVGPNVTTTDGLFFDVGDGAAAVVSEQLSQKLAGDCEKFPYDPKHFEYENVRQPRHPHKENPACKRKQRRTVPEGCGYTEGNNKSKKLTMMRCFAKKCPDKDTGSCPGKKHPPCPVVDTSINENYKPQDPCCESAKKRKYHKRIKPKVYVPEKPDYD